MEIPLRVVAGSGAGRSAAGSGAAGSAAAGWGADPEVTGDRWIADVVARVEPGHTVGQVADAIAARLAGRSWIGAPVARISLGERAPLDRSSTVADVALVPGETLVLGGTPRRARPRSVSPRLVVASGPDAGRWIDLRPGRHLVGRGDDADLVLTDPRASRRHLAVVVDGDGADDGEVRVEGLCPGRNPVRVDGVPISGPTAVAPERPIVVGAATLVVRRPPAQRSGRRGVGADAFGRVPFHRTPYFPVPIRPVRIEPIDVPERPDPPRLAHLAALLPLVAGVAIALLLGQPRYLLFAALSPIMVIGNHVEQRRRGRRRSGAELERFERDLVDRRARVRSALREERARRFASAPDVADLGERAMARSADLWVRHRRADDVLHLRFGVGDVGSRVEVPPVRSGAADLRARAAEALADAEVVADAPVTLGLAELGVVGLVGRPGDTSALLASLLIQSACLHSPEDLVIAAVLGGERSAVEWVSWLPHTRSAGSPLLGPHLAVDPAGGDALVAGLLGEVGEVASRPPDGSGTGPRMLLVVDDAVPLDPAPLSRLLDEGPQAGLAVLWLAGSREGVPRQASAVVECCPAASPAPSSIVFTDPDRAPRSVELERLGPEPAAEVARALAPLRDASAHNGATALPRVVPLFAALGVESIDADHLVGRWRRTTGHRLRAPIGWTETGPLVLDLVEHGPHGLIGGTSGSGKSELVMALVAGLMAENPPTRVSFLFVDYKGGASTERFRRAPHTVGHVTNLDGLLARRALTSLRAELDRRMQLLQGRAKDLAELIERHPDEAPPALVIVVDEFATLVKEIPDFVAGMVDIAQRGRSLGIHLLLATQRPSGSVDENIRANTNLRISLRTLDGAESASIIGTPDGAAIPAPLKGRGFARLGPGEPVAFQSAWSGAPLLAASGRPPVTVTPFGPAPSPGSGRDGGFGLAVGPGLRSGDGDPPGPGHATGAGTGNATGPGTGHATGPGTGSATGDGPGDGCGRATQLDALLDAVVEAAERLDLPPGRAPWVEALPEHLPLDRVRPAGAPAPTASDPRSGGPAPVGTRVVVGLVDDPEAQAQYPAVLDLARTGGLVVTGCGGAGKSTVLRTVAHSAALDDHDAGGGRLTILAIDVASRDLVALERLPQCAAVATGDDLEAVTRVIDRLDHELGVRRRELADAVARSTAAPDRPTVLLLVDGLDVLLQTLEQGSAATGLGPYGPRLLRLLTEGRQVGLHPVVATTGRAALRSGIAATVTGRLILRQAEPEGYREAGVPLARLDDLDLAPGRGFLDGRMVQVATPPTAAVEGLVGRVEPRLATSPLPRRIPVGDLPRPGSDPVAGSGPDPVARPGSGADDGAVARPGSDPVGHVGEGVGRCGSGPAIGGGRGPSPLRPVVGVADLTGAPYRLDLVRSDLSVLGDPRSGRSRLLATIAHQVAAGGGEVWAVAPPWSPLARAEGIRRSCLVDGRERTDRLAELAAEADALVAEGRSASTPRLLLIDDHDLLPEHDRELTDSVERLLGAMRWVAAGTPGRGFSPSPVAQAIRAARSLVLLRPHDPREAGEVLGVAPPWHPGLPMVEGRGLAMVDRIATIVQFADPFPVED